MTSSDRPTLSGDTPLYKAACVGEECTSSDGMQVYQGPRGLRGFCYVCETPFYNLDGESMERSSRDISEFKGRVTMEDVLEISTVTSIPDRQISEEVARRYGVRTSVDLSTGEIDTHYYPVKRGGRLVGYKVRDVATKGFSTIGDTKGADLFGMDVAGRAGKLLIVTEGELDALAAVELLALKGKNYRVASLPFGANTRSIGSSLEWLSGFESVLLSLDQDEAGHAVAKDISKLLPPPRSKIMTFSEKDPCDMLKEGKSNEFFNAIYAAQEYRPEGIVTVQDIEELAMKPVEYGISWPWDQLTDLTYGIRRKELYGFGAGSGCGKTEGFKEIIHHVVEVHKLPVGIIFLEEPVDKTLKVIAGKKANKRFHLPGEDWTVEELREGIIDLRGKVYLYDHFGSKGWEDIKSRIRYMVLTLGIKDIFLDHLTALVAQEADEYKALNRIMEEMAGLVQELDFTLYYISHLRKASGTPHEEGGRVSADQFKGSGAIVFWSNFLFGYERNQQADTRAEKDKTTFRVLKDRNSGIATGETFTLRYDHSTGRWAEGEAEDGEAIMEDTIL